MLVALVEAAEAANRGETPIGAVVVDGHGVPLAQDGNRTLEHHDPTGHGEMRVLRQAGRRVGDFRLIGCQLFVTLAPCPMCIEAASQARIATVHYAAPRLREKSPLPSLCLQQQDCFSSLAGGLMRHFFAQRRGK